MREEFKLEGVYMVNSHNPIINNKIGLVYYQVASKRLIFRLVEDFDIENIGDYFVNPESLSKVEDHELELMRHTRIYIDRPDGI